MKVSGIVEQFLDAIVTPPSTKLFIHQTTNEKYFVEEVDRLFKRRPLLDDPLSWKLEDFIEVIKNTLINNSIAFNTITPWSIETAKYFSNLETFLGKTRGTFITPLLPVVVTINNKDQRVLEFTEELMFGILSVPSSKFQFYIRDTITITPKTLEITLQDIDNYTNPKRNGIYTATILDKPIKFNTIDVIQGVITISSWLNENPHKYIRDIKENKIPVTF